MLRTRVSASAAFLATALFGGCVLPIPAPENPHVAGRVLDAATKRPIAGAILQFERYQDQPVVTTADGRFDIPLVSRVVPVLMPSADFNAHRAYLLVHARGYEPARVGFMSYKSHVHETILLKRR